MGSRSCPSLNHPALSEPQHLAAVGTKRHQVTALHDIKGSLVHEWPRTEELGVTVSVPPETTPV